MITCANDLMVWPGLPPDETNMGISADLIYVIHSTCLVFFVKLPECKLVAVVELRSFPLSDQVLNMISRKWRKFCTMSKFVDFLMGHLCRLLQQAMRAMWPPATNSGKSYE
jgi:hypothetical protein